MTMSNFDYFVVFAEMRTGSNYLEANINLFDGLKCHGEAFNPSFIGYPNYDDLLGITVDAREENPDALLDAIKADEDLAGFRFFSDHDQRVLPTCLSDPRCAKIILTRNPVDSFISWKIAKATGQWKLTNATHAKAKKIQFDGTEFAAYVDKLQKFQQRLQNALQCSGQTAFFLNYDDLGEVEIMNGLAAFLGCPDRLNSLDRKLKKQNPVPTIDKVTNPDDMKAALAGWDRFDLDQTPNFEPRRGPMIPAYVAAPKSGLLYLPLRGGIDDQIGQWMADLDERPYKDLRRGFSQKTLREWKRRHAVYRSFAVLRHPVARAHDAFCTHILFEGPQLFPKIRQTLRKVHKLPIPADPLLPRNLKGYDIKVHRKAFLAFLGFVKNNLSAQTAVRTDPAWASQLAVLQGMAQFGLPDMIMREDQLEKDLPFLCDQLGLTNAPSLPDGDDIVLSLLREIYDSNIEDAAQDAYPRDYLSFGFGDWM